MTQAGARVYSVGDLWAALVRHRRLALILGGGVAALGAAVALLTPSEYRAGAAVVVEPVRAHLEYAPPPVLAPIEERLRTVRQVIMGRDSISQVIRELGLHADLVADGLHDTAVERTRRSVEVHAEGETPFTFAVFFRDRDPEMAARAANLLAELFVKQQAQARVSAAAALLAIVEEELEGQRKILGDAHDRLVQFKVEHDGELPEQVEGQLRLIAHLGDLEENYLIALRSAARRRAMLDAAPPEGGSELGRVLAAEEAVRRRAQELAAKYLPGHPELVQAERQLEALRAERTEAEERAARMRFERDELTREMASSRAALARVQAEAARRKAQVANAARWSAPLARLEREMAAADARFQAVLRRAVDARVGLRLEEEGAARNFRFIERAERPDRPYRPNRARGLVLSLLAGVAVGLAGAFFRDLWDPAVRGRGEASRVAPVLAEVPVIPLRRS